MRVHIATVLNAPPEWTVTQVQSTAVFRHITAPLMRFTLAPGARWPAQWAPGEVTVHLWLLGFVPLGSQTVRISVEPPPTGSGWPSLRDNGEGATMRRWDHRIHLRELPDGRTLYSDDVEVVARHLPWLMTPVSAGYAQLFFRHRQRRLRRLADRYVARARQPIPPACESNTHRRRAFEHLLAGWAHALDAPAATRWRWLEAAHVLGQQSLPLHWRAHTAMLRSAWALGDQREVRGQVMRLALVPLGHLLQRLPVGNSGRARVSAFQPTEPAADVAALIRQAIKVTATPGVKPSCE